MAARSLFTALLFAAVCPVALAQTQPPPLPADSGTTVYQKVLKSTVWVHSERPRGLVEPAEHPPKRLAQNRPADVHPTFKNRFSDQKIEQRFRKFFGQFRAGQMPGGQDFQTRPRDVFL